MKKCRLLFLLILLLSLCGCSMIPNILSESRIETLKSWSFQYNSGTDDYSLFFALCDESDKYLSEHGERKCLTIQLKWSVSRHETNILSGQSDRKRT